MLYQQGTQRIEIIVRKEGGGGDAGAKEIPAEDAGGKGTIAKTSIFGSDNPRRIRRVFITNATHSVAVSKQVLDLAMEYRISGIGYKNGDQALQDITSRKVEKVKDIANVASSISMGIVYGAWGGPIGSIFGMLFAGVQTGISLAVKYQGREREYDYKIFKEQNAIEYNRARAGINLTNGRLR